MTFGPATRRREPPRGPLNRPPRPAPRRNARGPGPIAGRPAAAARSWCRAARAGPRRSSRPGRDRRGPPGARPCLRPSGPGGRSGPDCWRRPPAHSGSRDRRSASVRRRRTVPQGSGPSRRCRCPRKAGPFARPRRPPPRRWTRRESATSPRGYVSRERPNSRSTRPWRTRPCSSCRSARHRPPSAGRWPWRRRAEGSSPASATRRSSPRPACRARP